LRGHHRWVGWQSISKDLILAADIPAATALRQETRSVPVVFVNTVDPVGAGVVDSLAQPGGNITGFTLYEYEISAKWLELVKEIAPQLKRVAVLRDAGILSGIGQWTAIQAAARSFGVDVRPVGVGDADEIERTVTTFAGSPNGGIIVTASVLAGVHRSRIVALAARHRLPAVYCFRFRHCWRLNVVRT
jgi:putative ABC transport system substrate-binding protein